MEIVKIISVTGEKAEKRGREKYNKVITSENEEYFFTDEELFKFGIFSGSQFEKQVWEEKLEEADVYRAYRKGINIAVFKRNTRAEIYSKLMSKGVMAQAAESALELMEENGYINDEKYTESYIKSQMDGRSFKTSGIIKQELLRKGVSEDIIEKVFKEKYDCLKEDGVEKIKKFINYKYYKLINGSSMDYNNIIKIKRALYAKGYDSEDINRAINEIWGDREELD